jgi:hypothetical protein
MLPVEVQYEIAGDLRPLTRPDSPFLTLNAQRDHA